MQNLRFLAEEAHRVLEVEARLDKEVSVGDALVRDTWYSSEMLKSGWRNNGRTAVNPDEFRTLPYL